MGEVQQDCIICGLLQVLFAGQKIGEGIGRTRREAQHHAAEGSLFYLAGNILVLAS